MKYQAVFLDFMLKQWLLTAAGISLLLTSLYTQRLPSYSMQELEVLFILFVLFVTVNGLQQSGVILKIAASMEQGRAIPCKLVLLTFFLSMLVTNDVALLVLVPLTLSLRVDNRGMLVILEALAANAGSALTPFGNPQNLFIYWYYGISPARFILTIGLFSLVFLFVLLAASIFVKTGQGARSAEQQAPSVDKKAFAYGVLLFIVLLTVLHVLPVSAGVGVIIFALLFDRRVLGVDYALLFSFFFFFGVAENMKVLLAAEMRHSGHIFLLSALASQVMSNVPATLLFAKFTANWQALLWGANAGGFGSLVGSLANLIAYKLYISHESTRDAGQFTVQFLTMGYIAFFISIGLYFLLYLPVVTG